MSYISAIVPAAGMGTRMESDKKKQFLELKGIPIFIHTLKKLEESSLIDEIIVVTGKEDVNTVKELICKFGLTKISAVTEGGNTRQKSVKNGADIAKGDYILIHDGVRPLVSQKEIEAAIISGIEFKAAAAGIPLYDTIKLSDDNGFSLKTLPRENIVRILTPQVIKKELYFNAYKYAEENAIETTDDISLAEIYGVKPKISEGSIKNIKITRPEDIEFALSLMEGEN